MYKAMEDKNINFIIENNRTIEQIKDFIKGYNVNDREILAVLEYGNVDIELQVDASFLETGEELFYAEYYCCTNGVNGWESHGYANENVDISSFNTIEELKDDMLKELLVYVKDNNLKIYELNI